MEDNDGLNLTLALPCSDSSAISKGKEDNRDKKLIEDFKFFLEGGIKNPGNNYFNTLLNGAVDEDGYKDSNKNKCSQVVPEIRSNAGFKRKSSLDDVALNANLHEKTYVSITTDEGSTDDDVDETDSETEFSMSRTAPQDDDSSGDVQEVHRPFGAALHCNMDKASDAQKITSVIQSDGLDQLMEERQTIKPGIGGDVKFRGSGSFQNLPWVNTSGPTPNGRTISGVVYRYSTTQLRIVCACHGSHLSPHQFIQHARQMQASPPTGSNSGSDSADSTQS